MCSIVGLLDKNGYDVKDRLLTMLEMTSHRGPDGCGIIIRNQLRRSESISVLNDGELRGSSGIGHSRLRITGTSGIQPLFDCNKRFALGFNGEIWNYEELRNELQKKGHVFETDSDSEVIVHLIEENYKKDPFFSHCVSQTIKQLDGEWAFVVVDNVTKKAILARDPVGIKQLYYGRNGKYVAFSSERKPLFSLGLKTSRLLPGHIAEINFGSGFEDYKFKVEQASQLRRVASNITDENTALASYRNAIFESIRKRIKGQDHVGIIFSGGVDSVLIAEIAKQLGSKITCYISGSDTSSDISAARRIAKDLKFELKENEITEEKISQNLNDIILSIESTDHLQVDVAIPIYFAVKCAKEDGIRVMLTGQGADELFAGYPWYPAIFENDGKEKLNQSLWNDIKNLYKDTLEREDKIAMHHSIELRVPYLDPVVIRSAMSIAPRLKLRDGQGKYIHRKMAETLGIPSYLAWRPKEAAQHGSNTHEKLYRILEKKSREINLPSETKLVNHEKLGSAYRYKHDVYSGNQNIQMILDHIGKEAGLVPT